MAPPAPKLPASPVDDLAPRIQAYGQLIADWVRNNLAELLIATTVAIVVFLLLSWLRRRAARMVRNSEDHGALAIIAARTFARTGIFFRIMVSAELVNGYANAPHPVARTIDILFTIAAALQVAIWMREIILGMIERRAGESGGEHETLASAMVLIRLLVSFALFAIAAIVILANLGVNVTGLIAGLGVGGIAIGLAAQGIFQDLFAAISIIFDRPFKRGDTISYDMSTATVERIGMKSTRLRAITGEEKIISNSKLLDKEITNNTATAFRRTTYRLSLIYQTAPEVARRIPDMLREIVETENEEFVRAGFVGFGPSSIDFELVFDVQSDDFEQTFAARHNIGLAILSRFRDEGILFAYPTQTTFTAAPDGSYVMPYASFPQPVPRGRPKR